MNPDAFPRVVDQLVEVLRQGMLTGRWKESLPGRDRLARDLGVSHVTMEKAMRRLAKEGLLVSDGVGKRRRIVLPETAITPKHFRIRILPYEPVDRSASQVIDLMERLNKAGFTVDFAMKALLELGLDVKRIARYVRQNPADAWIVIAGSREVIKWFCEQGTPAYAYFGNKSGLPIAGCGVRTDIQPIIRRLYNKGHRRIVLLVREHQILPAPGLLVQNFLDALQGMGIETGSYHVPVWGHRPEGLHRCLDSLFKVTSPTALITGEAPMMLAVRDHLARLGIITPRDVSLICLDQDPSFGWLDPQIAHCTWDYSPITRHVLRWAKTVSTGMRYTRQTVTMSKFLENGTIGPASS